MSSNYIDHAWREFKAAGWIDEHGRFNDGMQEDICRHVLALLELFRLEGHSGTTAPYTVNLFETLAMFKPITALTGEDWEWVEVGAGVFQNSRCGHVFKGVDGQAYDGEGRIFWDWHKHHETGEMAKSHFTCFESRVPVTFPYTPKKEYVFRPSDEFPNEVI